VPGSGSVTFEYFDPAGDSPAELFGMWQTLPSSPASLESGPIAFGLAMDEGRKNVPLGGCWSIHAAVGEAAQGELVSQTERLRSAGDFLDADILDETQAKRLAEQAELGPTEASEHQQEVFAEFLKKAGRQVQHYAWVETTESGVLVAHSSVDWFGHLETVWMQGVSPAQMSLHHRSLDLALATRITTVKTAMTVVRWVGWAARLSVMSGPAVVLVLPGLIWQAVNQVIIPVLKSDLFKRR